MKGLYIAWNVYCNWFHFVIIMYCFLVLLDIWLNKKFLIGYGKDVHDFNVYGGGIKLGIIGLC